VRFCFDRISYVSSECAHNGGYWISATGDPACGLGFCTGTAAQHVRKYAGRLTAARGWPAPPWASLKGNDQAPGLRTQTIMNIYIAVSDPADSSVGKSWIVGAFSSEERAQAACRKTQHSEPAAGMKDAAAADTDGTSYVVILASWTRHLNRRALTIHDDITITLTIPSSRSCWSTRQRPPGVVHRRGKIRTAHWVPDFTRGARRLVCDQPPVPVRPRRCVSRNYPDRKWRMPATTPDFTRAG